MRKHFLTLILPSIVTLASAPPTRTIKASLAETVFMPAAGHTYRRNVRLFPCRDISL